ncbi:hypothetical protein Tco_0358971 [Tanacetum coccineum]
MNITSPSSSLEQINFVLEDWRTNLSDSSIDFSFRTCSVALEANGLVSPELQCARYSVGDGLQHSVDIVGHLALLLFEIDFKLG